jgi:hypothetical protein
MFTTLSQQNAQCYVLGICIRLIIKCTLHYIVHLQSTFSFARMKVRDSDFLAWVRGQKKMSQVLGAFELLDFTVLRPVLAWRAF